MITMGGDFHYSNATQNFENMDLLISFANAMSEETGLHLLYSTPSCYVRALHKDSEGGGGKGDAVAITFVYHRGRRPSYSFVSGRHHNNGNIWPSKSEGDFFPYISGTHYETCLKSDGQKSSILLL